MRYHVTVGEQTLAVEVTRGPDGVFRAHPEDGPELLVSVQNESPGLVELQVDGQRVQVLPSDGEVRFRSQHLAAHAESWLEHAAQAVGTGSGNQHRKVLASMPGRIIQISCQVGETVSVGAQLLVMEAMKMQNELSAKSSGVVRAICVSVGQNVERGELLVELE